MAILIEEGLYYAPVALIFIGIAWKYRPRIKGWLQNLGDAKAVDSSKAAEPEADKSTQVHTPQVPKSLRHSQVGNSDTAVPDEVRLQRAIARLQDQSSLEPILHTKRLKQEVIQPLLEYLSDIENKKIASISCRCILRVSAKTTDGKEWTCMDFSQMLNELPSKVVNLEIDGTLTVENSNSVEHESDVMKLTGWFIGDGDGSWKVLSVSQAVSGKGKWHEVPMYDWYQLKQRISKLVADFLESVTG